MRCSATSEAIQTGSMNATRASHHGQRGATARLYTGVTSDLVRRVWQRKEGTAARRPLRLQLLRLRTNAATRTCVARHRPREADQGRSRRKQLALIARDEPPTAADLYESII